jgi:hypothetical protein
LLKNGLENVPSRPLRNTRIEIVAKDGYKATFSWGEIFNNPIGSQVLLITKQDGKYLDVQEGPLLSDPLEIYAQAQDTSEISAQSAY